MVTVISGVTAVSFVLFRMPLRMHIVLMGSICLINQLGCCLTRVLIHFNGFFDSLTVHFSLILIPLNSLFGRKDLLVRESQLLRQVVNILS